jgi:hypothetical protein
MHAVIKFALQGLDCGELAIDNRSVCERAKASRPEVLLEVLV